MINPAELVDNLVALLRDIPELVIVVGGDPDNIYAYHDKYPQNVSIEAARYQMPSPGVMIAWQGTRAGSRGGFSAWTHDISISLRAKTETGSGTPSGYYQIYRLITKGIPTSGDGQPMLYTRVHPSCDPVDDIPPVQRQTDAAGIDYFEISMSFTEIGDD